MDSAFVIRLSYGPTLEPEFRRRFELFRDLTLPRLQAQTVPAGVWVWVHPRHTDEIRALGLTPFTVDGSPQVLSVLNLPWAAVRGVERAPVQFLMGSDDQIGPRFVETALATLAEMPEERALVTFQPWKYERKSGRWYAIDRPYSETRPSPFCAMRQPLDERYTWVWVHGHTRLFEYVDRVRVLPVGHCALTVHGGNLSTEITPGDQVTGAPSWA